MVPSGVIGGMLCGMELCGAEVCGVDGEDVGCEVQVGMLVQWLRSRITL